MMKRINIKILFGTILMMVLMMGCSSLLKETPRSTFTPTFFKTQAGVTGGVTSLYASLRNVYGNGFYNSAGETGTDEYTYGAYATDHFKVLDNTGQGGTLNSTNSDASVMWDAAFPAINTASGIIENGTAAGVSASLIAEAKFFRAFYYFQLVQTFGGVPLDLGAGPLKFNTHPIAVSKRNTVPEVYTKAIFPDLQAAVKDLPVDPRETGTVTQDVARLYLAKAYLTYAWWLQNPNSIPTYPSASRTDPDGHNAKYYFQQAYDVATTAINNPGPYGLMPTFYDLHLAQNDRNKEEMFYADHTQSSELYSGESLYYSNVGGGSNTNVWMMTWNYPNIRSSSSPTTWTPVGSVGREATQALGRPWIRMAPTIGAVENTFADKTNDSRYDGTFTTTYRGNWNLNGSGISQTTLYNANMLPIKPGDAVVTFLNNNPVTPVTYASGGGNSAVGAGTLPGRADFVVAPNGINRIIYPGLWKLGEYRTDNNGGFGQPNAGSTRPVVIAYFSQLYFIGAEAAVKGATTNAGQSARDLINVIRARAGMWDFDNHGDSTLVADHSAAMTAATPATITINYILAERSREYFGEGKRWQDLVRTQTWGQIAGSYIMGGSGFGDHTPQTITRNIPKNLYLRPIPQSEIDALQMTAAEKTAYQNPGYQ